MFTFCFNLSCDLSKLLAQPFLIPEQLKNNHIFYQNCVKQVLWALGFDRILSEMVLCPTTYTANLLLLLQKKSDKIFQSPAVDL